jgi:hypothetical protein
MISEDFSREKSLVIYGHFISVIEDSLAWGVTMAMDCMNYSASF